MGAFHCPYSEIRINGITSRFFFGGKFKYMYQRCCNSFLYSNSIIILLGVIFIRESFFQKEKFFFRNMVNRTHPKGAFFYPKFWNDQNVKCARFSILFRNG